MNSVETEVRAKISVKADFLLAAILVGLLFALSACSRQAQIQTQIQTDTQTKQPAVVKPTSTTKDPTSSQELLPLSAPAATQPEEPPPTQQTPATTVRPS